MAKFRSPAVLITLLSIQSWICGAQNEQNLSGAPQGLLAAQNRPIYLTVQDQPPRVLFEVVAKLAGINTRFDPDYDREETIQAASVDLKAVSVSQALDEIARVTSSNWRPLSPTTILVEAYKSTAKTSDSGASQRAPVVASRMLVVGSPKVYDDLYLQNLLDSLRGQLATVRGVDQATLLNHIGGVQGMDMRQSGVAVGATGPSIPGTSTFTPAPGVPAFSYPPGYQPNSSATSYPTGVATTTTPGMTTTVSPTTPTAPTPPAPTLTAPTVNQSSLGAYNESLQLSYEIMNTQLLLEGAVSDRVQIDGKPKTTFTLGFPITVAAPSREDRDLENAVAEVEISVCPESNSEPPSLVTLLPRERTYNVASLVDKSFLGSISAVLGGVGNVGGSFLWGHKTYYLVQQQETVAIMRAAGSCNGNPNAVAFAWQIRPVLGKTFVRPGDSINFVQVSVPGVVDDGSPTQQIGSACISIRWRAGDKKGNYLGPVVDQSGPTCYPIDYYSTSEPPGEVTVTDIGQGNVHVNVTGTFLPGSAVRLGSTMLNPATVAATHNSLTFNAPASAIATADRVYVVGRDDREREIIENQKFSPSGRLRINDVHIEGYSDTLSKVTVQISWPEEKMPGIQKETGQSKNDSLSNGGAGTENNSNPWVVIIGDRVFGLSDARFFARDDKSITLLVPTDLLRSSTSIEVRRLLWPDQYRQSVPIPATNFAKSRPTVSKVSILSSQKGLTLALVGSGLNDLMLVFPKCDHCSVQESGSMFATIRLPKPETAVKTSSSRSATKKRRNSVAQPPPAPDPTDGLKQILVCRGKPAALPDVTKASLVPSTTHSKPVGVKTLGMYSGCNEDYPVLLLDVPKLEAAQAKPALDPHDAVPVNTRQITVTGTLLDQVVSVEDGTQPLRFRLSNDKVPTMFLELPDSIAAIAGGHTLLVTFADKTTAAYLVPIQQAQ